MDLRQFLATPSQADEAASLLHYQPFVLDDNRHTGVAYSWLYSADPTREGYDSFLFDKRSVPEHVWANAWDANRRLAVMYDAFVEAIVPFCRGGSYLDVGCNTGYLPVRASLAGVTSAAGIDCDDYTRAFQILNGVTGSKARFHLGEYDACSHSLISGAANEKYDVVSSTAVLCHVPDPLYFLKAIANLATRAVFLWSGFVESNELLIRYNPENKFRVKPFPNGFDDGTSISQGLLYHSMRELGFPNCLELEHRREWLPADWHARHIPNYQPFRAFVFSR